MMGDPLLSMFPPPLLRLILCGGGGLPVAFGPISYSTDTRYVVDGRIMTALRTNPKHGGRFELCVREDEQWRLPLDHWRPRLAVVAAHLIGFDHAIAARIESTPAAVFLSMWTPELGGMIRGRAWNTLTGGGSAEPDLPTLPAHLLTHNPAVALLLSLFDVPEIRAKVEALNG